MIIRNITHSGANINYLHKVLNIISTKYNVNTYDTRLDHYAEKGNNTTDDVLIYQTFPDENIPGKFNLELVKRTDKLFNEFQGFKILHDAHDNGDRDAFSRFQFGHRIPRIKCYPSHRFMKKYNVILKSTFSSKSIEVFPDEFVRDIPISCKFGGHKYHHIIRDSVQQQLGSHTRFFDLVNSDWEDGREAFIHSLRKTMVSICAPGHGQYSGAYLCTLRAGALLFAHQCLDEINYMPFYNLKDGVDYVSYNTFNFADKLRWLINNPDKIHSIRMNGQKAIKKGYDPNLSAMALYSYLENQLK